MRNDARIKQSSCIPRRPVTAYDCTNIIIRLEKYTSKPQKKQNGAKCNYEPLSAQECKRCNEMQICVCQNLYSISINRYNTNSSTFPSPKYRTLPEPFRKNKYAYLSLPIDFSTYGHAKGHWLTYAAAIDIGASCENGAEGSNKTISSILSRES